MPSRRILIHGVRLTKAAIFEHNGLTGLFEVGDPLRNDSGVVIRLEGLGDHLTNFVTNLAPDDPGSNDNVPVNTTLEGNLPDGTHVKLIVKGKMGSSGLPEAMKDRATFGLCCELFAQLGECYIEPVALRV